MVYALQKEAEPGSDTLYTHRSGVLLVREAETRLALSAPLIPVESELDLLNACVDLVRGVDPDVLVGYDIARTSWGFLTARARAHYGERTVRRLHADRQATSWMWSSDAPWTVRGSRPPPWTLGAPGALRRCGWRGATC